jgi:hypothetical protein
MKFRGLCLIFCFIASGAYAQQRIPDLSMSPEESLRTPDVAHSGNTNNQPYAGQHAVAPGLGRGAAGEDSSGHFVDGYCDPNFHPATQSNSSMQSCLEQQKQQACDAYRALPADVKHAVSRAADCIYAASEADEDKADCAESDAARMALIRKYRGDEAATRALTSLPEDMVNSTGNCTRGGR